MRALIILLALAWGTATAFAHGGEAHGDVPSWTFDPWVVAPLLAAGLLYIAGMIRLWRKRGPLHPIGVRRALLYAAGWLTLAGALLSPLHWLGEHMFTFHMIEHEIIMAVSAPLLALAQPVGIALWGLPRTARRLFARLARSRAASGVWHWLTVPAHATALHGAALWIWHVPALLDATLSDVTLHRLQHLSFLVSSLLFWWALARRADAGTAAAHLFITMLHMSALGALIALAPRLLYPVQTAEALRWGLTPLEDQQLAGLTMWVPAGTIYAGAALAFAASWIDGSGGSRRVGHALLR